MAFFVEFSLLLMPASIRVFKRRGTMRSIGQFFLGQIDEALAKEDLTALTETLVAASP